MSRAEINQQNRNGVIRNKVHKNKVRFSLSVLLISLFFGLVSNAEAETNCPVAGLPRQFRLFDTLPETDPCEDRGTSIVVLTGARALYLCERSQAIAHYDVALGALGIIKTRQGDMKTPIGTYSLGRPRISYSGFHTFIPIGYPTTKQKALGYTGKNVGIHGPKRRFRCAGFLNAAIDWTDGCIAVADDLYISEIAQWLENHPEAKWIHILPPKFLLRSIESSM